MSKHTPGPWAYRECQQGGVLLMRGSVNAPLRERHPQGSVQIIPAADGVLMAAAPDLLAACREVYAILLDGMQHDYDDMTAALGRARAAIAKAECRA